MALPFDFEESVFEQEGGGGSRGRGPLASAYSARRCEPEWFCEPLKCCDDIESITVRKFRGDLAYKQQEFQEALREYSACLVLLPPSNTAMRRDIQESQARCLAHMGKHEEALRIAEILRTGATNTDHITATLNLHHTIYRLMEDVEKIIVCLQRLILLHPFHPGTWNLLAEAYRSLWQLPTPSSGAGGKPEVCQAMKSTSWGEKKVKDIWIYACASFVRARLLFQLMESNQSSFALENNLKAQQDIEDKVMSFGVEADVFSLMTKAMGEDLVCEKLREDGPGEVNCLSASVLTSIMTASAVEFEKKWFQTLKDSLSQKDGQT